MIKFYFNHAPNPVKVGADAGGNRPALRAGTGGHAQGRAVRTGLPAPNPNAKVPVIVDGEATVFDSNAILLYLAQKTGRFLPPDTPAERGAMWSWLMFVASGVGPFSGQFVHFRNFAPEPKAYAVNRYGVEARRHYGILNDRLATWPFMSATATASSTWRCGAGPGRCPSRWATVLFDTLPHLSGGRPDRPAPGRATPGRLRDTYSPSRDRRRARRFRSRRRVPEGAGLIADSRPTAGCPRRSRAAGRASSPRRPASD